MPHRSRHAKLLFTEGNRHLHDGDHDAAEACFIEARALAPDSAEIWANIAFLKERNGLLAEAEACYRHALLLLPDNQKILQNLGLLLLKMRRFGEAELLCRLAVELAGTGELASAWSNLGVLFAVTRREAEAERCYRDAIAVDPGYSKAYFNLSYLLLRQGRMEEGWAMLEYRAQSPALAAYFNCPRWSGEALDGRSLVIVLEAGHGDLIHFCRYVPLLKSVSSTLHITLICHPALKTLLATLAGVDRLYALNDIIPSTRWDYWVPVLSLPGLCGTRLDTIPAPIPYLAADPGRSAYRATHLRTDRLKVGLVWKGNPDFENDLERSLPSLATLDLLAAVPGVQFVSLQKGPGQDDTSAALDLLPLGAGLLDFADTAALIVNLDLVISVDTAVAHLAGALGKPCWVLLPDYRCDWRWLAGRVDTPWYPGIMRLFRQHDAAGWGPLIGTVMRALQRKSEDHMSGDFQC